jgi:hypothetical protein
MSDSYAHRWLATLLHASSAYWAVQAVVALGSIASSLMLEPVGDTADGMSRFMLRNSVDAALLFFATHVGIRPLLRLSFVNRSTGLRAWLGLLAWLLLLALASLGVTLLFDRIGVMSATTVDAIHFQAGGDALSLRLSGPQLLAIALVNTWVSYALWALLYLAWKAMQSRRRLQEQLRRARMSQLTHQLSPHFLFNAFNSIRAMVFENQQRAADLITQLSELFRFHLQHEARTEHSLEDEWQLAQRYLDIEATRLESRLRVEHHFDPVCLPQRLPSLTLLCLVENAIKHGIAPDPAGGILRLSAQPTAAGWMLEVENSRSERHAAPHGTGTGLANLRERLQLGFGNEATLEVTQSDTRFRVRLQLPTRSRHALSGQPHSPLQPSPPAAISAQAGIQ